MQWSSVTCDNLCSHEQLLRVAETHAQDLHGENALERDDDDE